MSMLTKIGQMYENSQGNTQVCKLTTKCSFEKGVPIESPSMGEQCYSQKTWNTKWKSQHKACDASLEDFGQGGSRTL